ncbi:MAG: Cytochrome c-type biogenesis protein CcmE [Firmicutes bacterium]|nr:Cytochrome c-type biogenesis protein CcmE [Bacillota bacterium]
MKRYDLYVLGLLFVLFAVGAYFSLASAFTPYTTFAEAKAYNRAVQVKGEIVAGTIVAPVGQAFSFALRDADGAVHIVQHRGVMPPTLATAPAVVAIGRFDSSEVFVAHRLLVRCPTKYRIRN